MRITCPQCGFFREIPDTKAPVTPTMATCPKCRHRFRFRPQPAPAAEESFVAAEPGVSSWRRPAARQERVATPPAAWESLEEPAVEAAPEELAPSGPAPVADATFAPDPTPRVGAVPQPEEIPADDEAVPPPTHWEQQPEPSQPLVQRRRLDALDEQDEPPAPTRPAKSAAKRQPAPTARESLAATPQPARQPGLEPKPEPDFSDANLPDEAPSDVARRIRARVEQGLDPTPEPEPVAAAAPEPAPAAPRAAKPQAESTPQPRAAAPKAETPAVSQPQAPAPEDDPPPADDQPQETTVRADGVRDIWARLQALDDRKAARPRLDHQRPAEDEPEEPAREIVTDPVPWERQDVYGFFPALILTLRKILFQPLDFFGNLPEGRPKSKALVFNLLISEFLLLIDFMWSLAGLRARIGSPGEHDALNMLGSSPLSFLLALLLVPLFISVGIYLDAWVTHLLLILFRSTKKSFDETFRVLCYSAAPTVLTAVPVAGQLLSPVILVWYMALQAIGLKKCHEGAYTQTLAAIFIKWSIYLFLLLAMLQSFTPGM
ncbi:MAG: Yip1 domain containing protein [Solidesulfovibrio magneticus str. Maddingley MBC34]|uniref:Yip1 domain containing protein n=1 Tax=Solidesulfovibrio magneticus str. Maddingley MBC34 TaxID=1206767 RepID=K6GEB8_9BACT|nr:MAG: Yip1 domain containing protein [Solidesulfovibrio magneticus str. Maddingley MBC34]